MIIFATDMEKNTNNTADKSEKMALSRRACRNLLVGLIVMVAGYILLSGGGSDDPNVFNYAMFDFRRLVAAPIVIILGIVIEIVTIMGVAKKK